MLIIPAIDIKDGCVVRFVQGKLDKKIYSKDPVKTARHWQRLGAKLLHIVDLDGAESGIPLNLNLVKEIVKDIDIPIEFGGGVRSLDLIKELLQEGVFRVVLGTRAVQDANFLKKAFAQFKDKIIVSIDAQENQVLIQGWNTSAKDQGVLEFARLLKAIGFKQVIYTDTSRDGTLKGPNLKDTKRLLKETGLKVIASGGVSHLDDIRRLKLLEKKGLVGIIIGKALYEGRFTLPQALKLVK